MAPAGGSQRYAQPVAVDALADIVEPNQLIFVAGSSGAPTAFMADLLRKQERSRNLRLLTSYVPGINVLEIDRLDPTACVTGLFMQPGLSKAQFDGRYRALPLTYSSFVRHVLDDARIDLTVVQVAPPDERGLCSLGPAVEFMPTVLTKSRRVLGLINHRTPRIRGSVGVPYQRFDFVCEVDTPLPTYSTETDTETDSIAEHIASLIADGSALQIGLGKVPMALSRSLSNHRNLRLHTGMLSDGLIDMVEADALDRDFLHTTALLLGSERLYEWASEFDHFRIVGCEVTHNLRNLLDLDNFVAVNSALEVDLFGQCNLEHANGRAISGAGGAPDFARGARLSRGGRCIVALNSTYQGRKGSRIVPCLNNTAIASLSRVDVDHVVTEHGVADLRGRSVHERARAIMAVAAPEFREELQRAWRDIAARL